MAIWYLLDQKTRNFNIDSGVQRVIEPCLFPTEPPADPHGQRAMARHLHLSVAAGPVQQATAVAAAAAAFPPVVGSTTLGLE